MFRFKVIFTLFDEWFYLSTNYKCPNNEIIWVARKEIGNQTRLLLIEAEERSNIKNSTHYVVKSVSTTWVMFIIFFFFFHGRGVLLQTFSPLFNSCESEQIVMLKTGHLSRRWQCGYSNSLSGLIIILLMTTVWLCPFLSVSFVIMFYVFPTIWKLKLYRLTSIKAVFPLPLCYTSYVKVLWLPCTISEPQFLAEMQEISKTGRGNKLKWLENEVWFQHVKSP